MDTRTLVVGQEVLLFGVGRILGTVLSVVPSIAVQTKEMGVLQFDENGQENDDSRYRRCGVVLNGPCPSLLPWEIVEASPAKIAAWKLL